MKEFLKKAGREIVAFCKSFSEAVEKANEARVQHYLRTHQRYYEYLDLDKK